MRHEYANYQQMNASVIVVKFETNILIYFWLLSFHFNGLWEISMKIKIYFQTNLIVWWLKYVLKTWTQTDFSGPHWRYVNSGLSDGLVPKLMLTLIYDVIRHHYTTIF